MPFLATPGRRTAPRYVTSDPRTGGLDADRGESVFYVDTGTGDAVLLYHYGTGSTAWCVSPVEGAGEPVTSDPTAGLDRPVNTRVLYVPFAGDPVVLYKYGPGDTEWCTWTTAPGLGTGGGVADGDKGDVAVSGSGATWTIDNDAVTYAKVQNVSATNKVLGRATAGAGDIEEIDCTAAGRAMIAAASATAQTALLDEFASGTKGLAPASGGGTANFLRADGSWAAPAGGGASLDDLLALAVLL